MSKPKVHRPIPAVILAIVSVQGGAAFAKELFSELGAAGTAGMRVGLSALILLAVFRPPVWRLTREQWGMTIAYGLVLGAMNLSFYLALELIPLGLAVTLEFIGPLGLAAFSSRRPADILWVMLAAVGVALLTPWQSNADALNIHGVMWALLAGGFWAAYIVLGGRVSKMLPGGQSVAIGMSFAFLVVMPFALAENLTVRLTPSLFAASLGVALLSSAVPYTLEMAALRTLPSRTFGILMSLEPAIAAVAGLVFLHEQLRLSQWLALVLVCSASAGAAVFCRPRNEVAPL